jgi:hypothetical protein
VPEATSEAPSPRFVALLSAILLAALVLAAGALDVPGLYYDEAVQARPAVEFTRGIVYGTPFPGSQTLDLSGRPFPWMTQPYMGALKSQLLIPSVWIFGASAPVLRLTTLCWALVGVALIAAFARRSFGERTAAIAALLLAFDPSLLLLARHDWGSFALSLLLRGAVLLLLWRWWETKRSGFALAGGLAVGLGLYNKVDFSIFLVAGGLGVLACGARPLLGRIAERPRDLLLAAGGSLVGMLPMLPSLASVFAARGAFAQEGERAEKLRTLWSMLDGTYFHHLLELGGLFDRMQEATLGQPSLLGVGFGGALLGAGILLIRTRRNGGNLAVRGGGSFLLVASATGLLAYMALPGAVRIHHALNIYPFPQLLIAWVLGRVAVRTGAARAAALALAAVIAIAGVASYRQTIAFASETGGRGRWSDSLDDFARELDARGESVVVSLDWGFHETLGFLTQGPRLIDAYPRIPSALAQRGLWSVEGSERNVYLLHEDPYDLFGYGSHFLLAVSKLDPADVVLERHLDREGELAFTEVRVTRAHRVLFRQGGFEIQTY